MVERLKLYFIVISIILLLSIPSVSTLAAQRYSIVIKVLSGEGLVELSPEKRFYNKGDSVKITASPSEKFISWDYALEGNDNEKEITVKDNILIGAHFAENEIKSLLDKKIRVENDERLFTLFSFLNYTGYDEENREFGKIRKAVRKDLEDMDINISNKNYYKEKSMSSYDYYRALRYIGAPPNFKILNKRKFDDGWLNNISDLDRKLKEFYEQANIEYLYNKYQDEYDKEMEPYKERTTDVLYRVIKYLKVDKSHLENMDNIVININLLERYQGGNSSGEAKDEYLNAKVMVTGPSEYPNLSNIAHEYMHGIISPVADNLKSEINELKYLEKEIPEGSQADKGYNSWHNIVDESIIRGLQVKFTDDFNEQNYIDYVVNHHGFILAEYFNKRFDEFESYNGTLEEFIQKLLEEYSSI